MGRAHRRPSKYNASSDPTCAVDRSLIGTERVSDDHAEEKDLPRPIRLPHEIVAASRVELVALRLPGSLHRLKESLQVGGLIEGRKNGTYLGIFGKPY